MPADDPTNELNDVLKQVRAGRLPPEAGRFATDALATTNAIFDTISEMEEWDSNVDAYGPTENQERALRNIYNGAISWLLRRHIED